MLACFLTPQGDSKRGRKVLVFCNTVDSCRAVEHHCSERGLPTVCYHGSMPIGGRREAFLQFLGGLWHLWAVQPAGGEQQCCRHILWR